jgi:predicted RNase H-like HicB family nuclease
MNPNGYSIIVAWSEEDQAFIAMVPELAGCMAHGETRTQAIGEAEIAIENWLDTARELGREIPSPTHWADYETQVDQRTQEEFKNAVQAAIAENAPAITEALAKEITKSGENVSVGWLGHRFWWLTGPPKKPPEPIQTEQKKSSKSR